MGGKKKEGEHIFQKSKQEFDIKYFFQFFFDASPSYDTCYNQELITKEQSVLRRNLDQSMEQVLKQSSRK